MPVEEKSIMDALCPLKMDFFLSGTKKKSIVSLDFPPPDGLLPLRDKEKSIASPYRPSAIARAQACDGLSLLPVEENAFSRPSAGYS